MSAPRAQAEEEVYACQAPSGCFKLLTSRQSSLEKLSEDMNSTLDSVNEEGWNALTSRNSTADTVGNPIILSDIRGRQSPRHAALSTPIVGEGTFEALTSTIGGLDITSMTEITTSISPSGQRLNPRRTTTTTTTTTKTKTSTVTKTVSDLAISTVFSVVTESQCDTNHTVFSTKTVTSYVATQTVFSTITRAEPNPSGASEIHGSTTENPDRSSSPSGTVQSTKIIAPTIIASLLGVLLLAFAVYAVLRRTNHFSRIWPSSTREEIDPWDARPLPNEPENPFGSDSDPKRQIPADLATPARVPSIIGPAATLSSAVVLGGETPSRGQEQRPGEPLSGQGTTSPFANAQSGDIQDEPTNNNSSSYIGLPQGVASPTSPGHVNVMPISEILEGFTSEIRAEIQRAVASRPEGNSLSQWQQGWNFHADPVPSTFIQRTAPPKYQE